MHIWDLNYETIWITDPEGTFYRFTGPCVVTGKEYSVDVPASELFRIGRGEKIQDVLPDMPAENRA